MVLVSINTLSAEPILFTFWFTSHDTANLHFILSVINEWKVYRRSPMTDMVLNMLIVVIIERSERRVST